MRCHKLSCMLFQCRIDLHMTLLWHSVILNYYRVFGKQSNRFYCSHFAKPFCRHQNSWCVVRKTNKFNLHNFYLFVPFSTTTSSIFAHDFTSIKPIKYTSNLSNAIKNVEYAFYKTVIQRCSLQISINISLFLSLLYALSIIF